MNISNSYYTINELNDIIPKSWTIKQEDNILKFVSQKSNKNIKIQRWGNDYYIKPSNSNSNIKDIRPSLTDAIDYAIYVIDNWDVIFNKNKL